mmetsp:Transcript_95009/g.205146  ORF Transcript_95009/g.205146 Transcript_95009/m.205146 type:complete len:539 (-) Transcript_95009:48-1664(-)
MAAVGATVLGSGGEASVLGSGGAAASAPTLLTQEAREPTKDFGEDPEDLYFEAREPEQGADPEGDAEPEDEEREPNFLMQLLLCATAALEGADTALLPAAMKALQEDIGLKLTDLAYLNTAQAVCTNLAAPFWGIMADRGILQRKSILIIGSLGQGLVTCLLAVVTVMGPMIFMRAANGALLAALRPISNGIIADMTGERNRGKIFGRVQSSLMFGMFVTTLVAVPMARKDVFGIQGWRVAFCLIGVVSLIVSALLQVSLQEPGTRHAAKPSEGGICKAVLEEILSLTRFFRIPTFCVMIVQGIFGTIPWSVMGNMTLYFQLSGISDSAAALLSSVNLVAAMLGNVLAGYVADSLASKLGYHGRPLNAQISVALGVPCIFTLFYGLPPGDHFWAYLALIVAFGLLGSWAQSGTNFPILSAIVPSGARSRVMAWECALENSIANALGPVVVAMLATKCFDYTFGEVTLEDARDPKEDARSLGTAMAVVVCVPWGVCFLAYSLLHWSYPRDMERLLAAEEAERKKAAPKRSVPDTPAVSA